MRNLKRVLSLTLASVMLLGMMVIGSSAAEAKKIDFIDADEIENTEAVDVMVALGVLEGNPNGGFNPKGTLTREAAAKIICYMLLGEENAEKLTANKDVFTDVAADRWSAGYISYCVERNILAGTGNGNFNPTGELTGVAFGKMLLVALGYDPAIQGYVGSNWALSVAADMVDASIAPSGVLLNAPMTREQAAQAAFQTLTADVVSYASKGTTVNTTDGTSVIVGASKAEAVTWNDVEDYDGSADGIQQFCEKYFPDLTKADDEDDFGRQGGVWKMKSAEIVFAADEPDARFTDRFTYRDLYNALGSSLVRNLNDDDYAGTIEYWVDGDADTPTGLYHNDSPAGADYDLTGLYGDRTKTNSHLGDRGLLTEVYVDDDDNVTVVMVNTYLAQVEGDYDEDDEELELTMVSASAPSADTTLKLEDFATLPNYSDEDYVLVTIADDEIKSIQLADTVTGNVDRYTRGSTVTIDGETYNYNKNFHNTILNNSAVNMAYDVNEEATVLVDNYGFVIGLKEAEGSDDYVFINAFDEEGRFSNADVIAEAFFTDGTKSTITLDKVDGEGVNYTDSITITRKDSNDTRGPGWYTFTEKDGEYKLTSEDTEGGSAYTYGSVTAPDMEVISEGRVQVYYGNTSYLRATNSTVFVVNDDDEITVTTGVKNAPTITLSSTNTDTKVWAARDGSYTSYVYVDVGHGTFDGATTDSGDVVYVYDTTYDFEDDGTEKYTYDVILNGRKDSISANDDNIFDATGLYKKIRYDSDDLVDRAELVASSDDDWVKETLTNATIEEDNGTLIFNQSSDVDLHLASGAAIWVISGTDADRRTTSWLVNNYGAGVAEITTGTVWASLKDDEATGVYIVVGSSTRAVPVEISGDANTALGAIDSGDKQDSSAPVTLTSSQTGTTVTFTVRNVKADKAATITYNTSTAARAGDSTVETSPANAEGVATATITVDSTVTKVTVTNVTVGAPTCDHTSRTHVDANSATCTEDGNIEYWTCTCGKYWNAATDGDELTQAQTVTNATGHQNRTSVPAQKGTDCQHDGTKAYWTCSDCNAKLQSDSATAEIATDTWLADSTNKGDHSYGAWTEVDASNASDYTGASVGEHARKCSVTGCDSVEHHANGGNSEDCALGSCTGTAA